MNSWLSAFIVFWSSSRTGTINVELMLSTSAIIEPRTLPTISPSGISDDTTLRDESVAAGSL